MIVAISAQSNTEKLSTYQCASMATRPAPMTSLPSAEAVKAGFIQEIGDRADAGIFGSSVFDLQALVGALVGNYGTESGLTLASAKTTEATTAIDLANQGSSQAAQALQQTGHRVVQIDNHTRSFDKDLTKHEAEYGVSKAVGFQSEAEHEVHSAAAHSALAEGAKEQAQAFALTGKRSDRHLVVAAAEGFLQRTAARESAARLRRALAKVTVENAEVSLRKAQERQGLQASQQKDEAVSLDRLRVDREFMERLLILGDELIGG